ncbi:DUF2868 domain-containing protein [Nitrogeniibacter mangrovi]|uniref:DUF2868 domain-containing protein n=1 Tax=Nitrogeniibacter mangrovi TaxID=2016596 RepID=UPI001C2D8F09|nr:DUF2868 domain-containing protein [Nitrogeniibacter mangrovi]
MTPDPLDAFELRWLAEATRLREQALGPLDAADANRAARTGGGSLEQRVCQRARVLDETRGGMADALRRWRQHAQLVALGLGVAAIVTGIGLGASVLGDGQRPVNVIWALTGLLGLHGLTLLIWLAAAVGLGSRGASLAGRLWLDLTGRLGRRRDETWLPRALVDMGQRHGVLTAWLGRLSHGLWTLTLVSALASLLALLATRRYGFVWETTILSEEVFVHLTRALGVLPGLLGLPMPDAAAVHRAGGAAPFAADRQLWSAWLTSALVVYGLLPRALLWAWCAWRWRGFRRHFRLDLDDPGYARLARHLSPPTEAAGVSDAAPGQLPTFHTDHGTEISDHARQALALELGPDLPWPPAALPVAQTGGRLDTRDARRAALDALAAHPVERLLVAVDARLSPDRGALALLAELSRYSQRLGVWLCRGELVAEREPIWRDALERLGVGADDILAEATTARHWLEADDD